MMAYSYPATLEPDPDGRLVVHFPALPEALTDGADEAEALREAADCLSEALASRIVDGEEIPTPGPLVSGQYLVSPSPTIALKAALYEALRRRDMTVADVAARLDMDWHQAARLIDPRRASKLTSLSAALRALDCEIRLLFHDRSVICTAALAVYLGYPLSDTLLRELKRVETEAIFQKRVFFVQSLGFITPTEARRISFEESLRFERVHEETYRNFGFELVPIAPGSLSDRVDATKRSAS